MTTQRGSASADPLISYSKPDAASEASIKLADLEIFVRRFVVLPEAAYLPVALWVLLTYCPNAFDCMPYLGIQSPVKRSGKTRLLEVLELLCRRPWIGTSVTAPTLFRMMKEQPTLLLDEVEVLKRARSESALAVTSVLNAGHRKGATVPRCEGAGVVFYPVYCPKAFATIHELPDTLQDRSIIIKMERKQSGLGVERFLLSTAHLQASLIANSIAQWVKENEAAVRLTYESLPDIPFLSDRDADLWRPLFALCELLAPERIDELRWCARRLSSCKAGTEEALGVTLLESIRSVWTNGESAIATADLLERIAKLKQWHSVQMTPRMLGQWLRPFEVSPRQVRLGETTCKGYARESFRTAWARFLGTEETDDEEEMLEAA